MKIRNRPRSANRKPEVGAEDLSDKTNQNKRNIGGFLLGNELYYM